jgi:hypothetical protein
MAWSLDGYPLRGRKLLAHNFFCTQARISVETILAAIHAIIFDDWRPIDFGTASVTPYKFWIAFHDNLLAALRACLSNSVTRYILAKGCRACVKVNKSEPKALLKLIPRF